jgi:ATP-dependent Lon protease
VIAPERNEQDIEEIPEHLRKDLSFRFVATAEEALEIALHRRPVRRRPRALTAA